MSSDENIDIVLANGENIKADLASLAKLFENEHKLLKQAAEKRNQLRHDKFLREDNFLTNLYSVSEIMTQRTFAERIYTKPGAFGRTPLGVPALIFYSETSFMEKEYYMKDEEWRIVFSNFMNYPIASAPYWDEEAIYRIAHLLEQPLDALETMLALKYGDDPTFLEKMETSNNENNSNLWNYATTTLNTIDKIPAIKQETLEKLQENTNLKCSRINILDPQLYRYIDAPCIIKIFSDEKYNVKQINKILDAYDLVVLSGYRKTEFLSPYPTTKYAVSKKYKKMFNTYPRNISQIFIPHFPEQKRSIFAFLLYGMDGVLCEESLDITARKTLIEQNN